MTAQLTDLPAEILHAVSSRILPRDLYAMACTNQHLGIMLWRERIGHAAGLLARSQAALAPIVSWAHADYASLEKFVDARASRQLAMPTHADVYVGAARGMPDEGKVAQVLQSALWHAYVDKRWRVAFRLMQLTVDTATEYHVSKAALLDAPPEVFHWLLSRTPQAEQCRLFGGALVQSACEPNLVPLAALLNIASATRLDFFLNEAVREAAGRGHARAVSMLLAAVAVGSRSRVALTAFLSALANGHMGIVDATWPLAREFQTGVDQHHGFSLFRNRAIAVSQRGRLHPPVNAPSYECNCAFRHSYDDAPPSDVDSDESVSDDDFSEEESNEEQ